MIQSTKKRYKNEAKRLRARSFAMAELEER